MSEPEALTDDPVQVEVLRTETPFTGRVWNIRRDAFAYNGDTIVREYVDHTGAVAVLAMDDQERVLLIKQYRHPVRARDWEIPAGLLDVAGEDALAAREAYCDRLRDRVIQSMGGGIYRSSSIVSNRMDEAVAQTKVMMT